MKWHYENVIVACLSDDEVHKALGDPQDKLALLKIFKTTKRKHQETLWKLPENLDSKEKSHLLGAVRFVDTEHDAKKNHCIWTCRIKVMAIWSFLEFKWIWK